nr:GntR family transcriptional regulator [Halomonas socia]
MVQRGDRLSVLAYREIEDMILTGKLKPGERLNEHHFSEKIGVSRGPIREACRALERAGLVTAVPAKGVFVRELSERHLNEVYDLRAVITGLMCQCAAERADRAACQELRQLNDRMRVAAKTGNQADYYNANLEFHNYIAKLANNETAKRVYDDLVKETHAHRIAAMSTDDSITEHEAIISAIEARDVDASRWQGEAHVIAGKRRWNEMRLKNHTTNANSN